MYVYDVCLFHSMLSLDSSTVVIDPLILAILVINTIQVLCIITLILKRYIPSVFLMNILVYKVNRLKEATQHCLTH